MRWGGGGAARRGMITPLPPSPTTGQSNHTPMCCFPNYQRWPLVVTAALVLLIFTGISLYVMVVYVDFTEMVY